MGDREPSDQFECEGGFYIRDDIFLNFAVNAGDAIARNGSA